MFRARQRERCPLNWDDGSSLRSRRLCREDTWQVRLPHTLARISAVFDDPNLVSHGGLVPWVPNPARCQGALPAVAWCCTRCCPIWSRGPGIAAIGLPVLADRRVRTGSLDTLGEDGPMAPALDALATAPRDVDGFIEHHAEAINPGKMSAMRSYQRPSVASRPVAALFLAHKDR